jgi:RNA polymerase sigma-70 factor (ECF subfamily)
VDIDDAELLDKWRRGDRVAGTDLFRRHFPAVRRFFRNKAAAQDVEDLVQRTFAGLVESTTQLTDGASFRSLLFGVARNQLYKFLRDRGRREGRHDEDVGVSSIHALGISPTGAMASGEALALVQAGLQRVCIDHQVVLELFYWENLPGADIAESLGVAPATVRTRLHRARQALEEAIEALLVERAQPAATLDLPQLMLDLRASL